MSIRKYVHQVKPIQENHIEPIDKIQNLFDKNNLKSILINTVHDSVVVDVHPNERGIAVELMRKGSLQVIDSLKEIYGIDFNVPLDTEVKIGNNWLNLKLIT